MFKEYIKKLLSISNADNLDTKGKQIKYFEKLL